MQSTNKARAAFQKELDFLENEYDVLLYGGVADSFKGGPFEHESPQAVLASPEFSHFFFEASERLGCTVVGCSSSVRR